MQIKCYVCLAFFIAICLLSASDAKKLKQKNEAETKKVRVVREVPKPKVRPSDPNETPEPSRPASHWRELQEDPNEEEFIAIPRNEYYDQQKRPSIHKPKSLKVLSAYEVCKHECRRERDQESEREYVDRLREELRLAEEQLQGRENGTNNEF